MALEVYNTKRRFDRTPEPQGQAETSGKNLFIVQQHDATRLHYDFRLEMDGVLKSWAVTRGPSLDPAEKRLAVHVEDHPISYGDFEGIIPKGEYGGGTVILWDRGQWEPVGDPKKGYRKGHLEFELDGEKLRGRWHLIRMRGKPEEKRENWLLIKGEDEEARPDGDILVDAPLSVKSGRALKEVKKNPDAVWHSRGSDKDSASNGPEPAPKRKAAKTTTATPDKWPKGARKSGLPDFVDPELATLKPKPPSGPKWLHEIKFDGYRLQVHVEGKTVKLLTRSGLDWTEKFGKGIVDAFAGLSLPAALIDGEVVVEKDNGASDFSALQQDLSEGKSDRFVFYAFDLLHLDDHDLRNAALIDRKTLLESLIPPDHPVLRYSRHFDESGGLVLDHACRLSLEGVISKDRNSKYLSGRKGSWVKSKCSERQEFVIGGFAPSSVSDHAIGSLALGVYEKDKLRHVGRVGTGFSQKIAEMLFERLSALKQDDSPFDGKLTADARRDLAYVKPNLVAEVEFRAWSGDGNLRHAAFRGLRDDKPSSSVVQENDKTASAAAKFPLKSNVKFTHPDRLYWPDEGVTKAGLADYYAQVWHLMAPFLVDRPLALLRCPDGIGGPRFFQKHPWRGINRSIDQIQDPKDKKGQPLLRIMDLDGLMSLVQSAVLEIHPWGTTTKAWETPDMITMDLDPDDEVPWSAVIEGALELKRRIEASGLAAFVKTSGGKGLHVVIPLKPQARWPAVKAYAKSLAEDISRDHPDSFLAVSTKAKRKGKIFVDYLRNGRGNTAVAAYSSRARPGAAISMPLAWSELSEEIGPAYFTINNVQARLSAMRDDPWKGFFAARRPLPAK